MVSQAKYELIDEAAVEAFFREARIGKEVTAGRHPNLVATLDYGHWSDHRPFLVMEFVKGTTAAALLDEIRKSGKDRYPPHQAYRPRSTHWAGSLAQKRFHSYGISLDNILVSAKGDVKLGNFGRAKSVGEDNATPSDDLRAVGLALYALVMGTEPPADAKPDLLDNMIRQLH